MTTFDITNAVGIDIGCGASCIYPLLSVRMNPSWHLYAVETNEHSFQLAQANIVRNNLTDRIEVIHETSSNDPFTVIESSTGAMLPTLDFTMCNPPFFDENADADNEQLYKNRTGNRPQPNNIKTGIACELMTPGGELAFVKRMIQQSDQLRDRVNVFTTMLGHKASVNRILDALKSTGVFNFCTSEFCQGRTTRWGIAWTYKNDLLLRTVPALGITPAKGPIVFTPSDIEDIDLAIRKLKQILSKLISENAGVDNRLENPTAYCLQFCGFSNTWSKQRRQRREQIRNQSTTESTEDDEESPAKRGKYDVDEDKQDDVTHKQVKTNYGAGLTRNTPPLIHIEFIVRAHDATDFKTTVSIELRYLNGSAGVNGLHEILQFIRNSWTK